MSFMLSVAIKPFMLSVVMRNVIMLSVVAPMCPPTSAKKSFHEPPVKTIDKKLGSKEALGP